MVAVFTAAGMRGVVSASGPFPWSMYVRSLSICPVQRDPGPEVAREDSAVTGLYGVSSGPQERDAGQAPVSTISILAHWHTGWHPDRRTPGLFFCSGRRSRSCPVLWFQLYLEMDPINGPAFKTCRDGDGSRLVIT